MRKRRGGGEERRGKENSLNLIQNGTRGKLWNTSHEHTAVVVVADVVIVAAKHGIKDNLMGA